MRKRRLYIAAVAILYAISCAPLPRGVERDRTRGREAAAERQIRVCSRDIRRALRVPYLDAARFA